MNLVLAAQGSSFASLKGVLSLRSRLQGFAQDDRGLQAKLLFYKL